MSAAEAQTQMRALGGAESYMDFLRWTRGRTIAGLADVRCPVLIAWGSRDLLLPRWQAERFVRAIPGTELRPLRGVGHVPIADDPDLVGSTIGQLAAAAETAGTSTVRGSQAIRRPGVQQPDHGGDKLS